jgi:hypothetical protein
MNGFGLRRWSNGSSYSGEFADGEANGQGVYIATNGDRYEGAWRNNKRDGHDGELTLANGHDLPSFLLSRRVIVCMLHSC